MAVKYVKDFAFDSGFGFTGSKGATPVRAYMRGGAVKKSMNEGSKKAGPRAPALAPAMVEQRSKGLGGLTPETKKLASYDKPHMEGKKGAKVPQYAKGGAVKKHVKKPMAKMMKKANGGPVAEITEGDGMSPLQAMAMPMPKDEGRIIEERMLPSLPPGYEPPPLGGDLRDLVMIGRPVPMAPEPQYPVGPKPPDDLDLPPVSALTPIPEEPYGRRSSGPPPPPGMKVNPNYGKPGQDYYIFNDDAARQDALSAARAAFPSPLAAATRMAPQDRRAMRADRNEMARDIMNRYIGGPRRAMPAARRAMPVAPRKPMIQIPRAPQGGIATFAKGGKVSKGEKKIGKVMGEFKRGELHSGSKQGPLVTNPKQAKAIALSEARAAGAKIPKKAMGGKACG